MLNILIYVFKLLTQVKGLLLMIWRISLKGFYTANKGDESESNGIGLSLTKRFS